MFPLIQTITMTVWRMMNRQLPMKLVTASAMRAPIGASSYMTLFTGWRLGGRVVLGRWPAWLTARLLLADGSARWAVREGRFAAILGGDEKGRLAILTAHGPHPDGRRRVRLPLRSAHPAGMFRRAGRL